MHRDEFIDSLCHEMLRKYSIDIYNKFSHYWLDERWASSTDLARRADIHRNCVNECHNLIISDKNLVDSILNKVKLSSFVLLGNESVKNITSEIYNKVYKELERYGTFVLDWAWCMYIVESKRYIVQNDLLNDDDSAFEFEGKLSYRNLKKLVKQMRLIQDEFNRFNMNLRIKIETISVPYDRNNGNGGVPTWFVIPADIEESKLVCHET